MQAVLLRHLFALGFPFILGIYLIPIVMMASKKIGFLDNPDGRLKHQKEPVPYLGGVGVFLPFIMTLGICYPFENQVLWLLLGTTLLLFIGLIDDLKVLKPGQKFFGQFIAVLSFLKGEFSLKTTLFSSAFDIFLSGFWMLLVINAFNLVDVMDGLCATLALTSAATFCFIAWVAGKYTVSLLLMAFIGSVAAFFLFNKPPAKIYLGDAGSLFIGGFLAAMPLLFDWDPSPFGLSTIGQSSMLFSYLVRPLVEVFLIPCLIMGIPLLEVSSLFMIRTYLGIPFYRGSPHHFSIYLQRKGLTKWQTLALACFSASTLSVLALMFLYRMLPLLFLLIFYILFLGIWSYIIFVWKERSNNAIN